MNGTQIYDPLNYVHSDRIGEKNLRKLYQKIHTEFLSYENEICHMDTSAYLAERYKKTIPDGIELPDSAEELLRQYDRISSEAEKTSKEKTEIINRLKEMLGEHEIGYSGARTVSWKKISKSSLDTKKVKEKLGDDYEDYLTESSYRRFMIA